MHQIFQRTGITPDKVLDMPRPLRNFVLRSMQVQLEQENERDKAMLSRQQQMMSASRGSRRRR